MRADALARAILVAGGLAIAMAGDWWQTIISYALVIGAAIIAGQFRLMGRILLATTPLLAVASLLWLFIRADNPADISQVADTLFRQGSPLLPLLRTLAGSAAIVLAIATAPDGQLFPLLRILKMPRSVATLVASGGAVAAGMPASYSRSLAALRAQGIVGAGGWAQFKSIGQVLSLTWVATLSISFARAEQKWVGNGFLRRLDPPPPAASKADFGRSIIFMSTGGALLVLILSGGP
jgi:hypothetical protein